MTALDQWKFLGHNGSLPAGPDRADPKHRLKM